MQCKKKAIQIILLSILISITTAVYNPARICAADTGDKSVTARIPISCEGKNTTETFQYQLQGEKTEYEKIERPELSLKDGEESEFLITYTYPGTYHYTVSQVMGKDDKTTYDGTIYQVDVYVTETTEDALSTQPIVYQKGSEEKEDKLIFKNTRKMDTNPGPKEKFGKNQEKVKTGDTLNLTMWERIMAGSAVVLVGIIFQRKQRRREDRENA